MDEYVAEIFMHGTQTITLYNICEDSLLASPLILDLCLLTDLFSRITYRNGTSGEFKHFHPVLGILAYLLKAPVVKPGAPVVNALGKQRQCLENVMRACVGLQPQSEMQLEHKLQ